MKTTLNLMVGLPVEVVQDRSEAQAVLRKLRAWVVGEHHFTINKQPTTVYIKQVKAIAQPVGAYFAWGANINGRWRLKTEALKKPVAICDIGFNTLDLFAVENSQIIGRFTGGDTLGMYRVSDTIIRHVRAEYGVSLSLYQADQLMRDYLETKKATLYYAAGEANLNQIVEQALDEAFAGVSQFIRQHWERGTQFQYLLLTGGGAQAFRERLLDRYPQAIIPSGSVTANVEGIAKFSVRPRVFSEPADRQIAIDPGFGGFKVAEVRANQVHVDVIPSVVGIGKTDLGQLSVGMRAARTKKPLTVGFDGIRYLVGANVHLYARPVERLDFKRLSEGPEVRALLYAALWKVLAKEAVA
jgi:hypothetical protein